jgi:hypothetical protein
VVRVCVERCQLGSEVPHKDLTLLLDIGLDLLGGLKAHRSREG